MKREKDYSSRKARSVVPAVGPRLVSLIACAPATMTITLKPEQEQIIQAEIASGHFRNPEEVLDYTLAVPREKDGERKTTLLKKNLVALFYGTSSSGS
jgi:hypothetical protein